MRCCTPPPLAFHGRSPSSSFTASPSTSPRVGLHRSASVACLSPQSSNYESGEGDDEGTCSKARRASVRAQVVAELVATESVYWDDLRFLILTYEMPLRDEDNCFHGFHRVIFQNVVQVAAVTERLLVALTPERTGNAAAEIDHTTDNGTRGVCEIFLAMIPELQCYKEYLTHHYLAVRLVNKLKNKNDMFQAFLKAIAPRAAGSGNDLESLLITPVQRILRYLLLLKTFLHNTPKDHPDFRQATQVVHELNKLAEVANSSIAQEQNQQKLAELKQVIANCPEKKQLVGSDHFFVKEGFLTKLGKRTTHRRYFWLFNDCLAYGEALKPPTSYSLCHIFSLEKMKVVPMSNSEQITNGFQIKTPKKSFVVMADTPQEKLFWVVTLEKIIPGCNSMCATAPVWIPDSFSSQCMMCAAHFTPFKRRHHCRACGVLVCDACSTKRIVLAHLGESTPARVCTPCCDLLGSFVEVSDSQEDVGPISRCLSPAL
eukprot:TRINITY_DN3477_c0_g1_i3.p1 TRINITY_DN3477_c0_g1~~TRINITY_DN3477_c0_g1_i3.p1  ORF type:complete len:501 (-),score=128.24 TRINITY_DN3477_c0_g1_i3:39-1499(-)